MKKKVLLISNEPVLPLNSGARLRTWNFVEALRDECDLFLFQSHEYDIDFEALHDAPRHFVKVWNVPSRRRSLKKTLGRRVADLIGMVPWEIANYVRDNYAETLDQVLREEKFDVILARYIYQGRYLFPYIHKTKAKLIIDLDDIETRKRERLVCLEGYKSGYDRLRWKLDNWVFARYHKKFLRHMDCCLVCSEDDQNYLCRRKWSNRVAVIPNAIDGKRYQMIPPLGSGKTILFPGALSYEPNVDAIVWFARKIFPLIQAEDPEVRLQVAGRQPSPEVLALDNHRNIFVHGDVPDIRDYYAAASLVITPIRVGGGTRIKIIEAGFCRRPVVSTTIGAEGLGFVDRQHGLLADTAELFARACLEVLRDPGLARRLAETNYQFVQTRYELESVRDRIRRAVLH